MGTSTSTVETATAVKTTTAKRAATTARTAAAKRAATTARTAAGEGTATAEAATVHREVTPAGETATAYVAASHAPAEGSEGISPTPRSTKGAVVSGKGTIGAYPTAAVKTSVRSVHRSTVHVTSLRAERVASCPLTAVHVAHPLAATSD
jgi:hypothetical protein